MKFNEEGPCEDCKGNDKRTVTFDFGDGETATHVVCAPCFDIAEARIVAHRQQFEFLLANGVSRAKANEIMIRRIDRGL